MCSGRPSATSAASLVASPSVGCAAIESPTVSSVASASIATTPGLDQLRGLRADGDHAEQLAVARLADHLDEAGAVAVHGRAGDRRVRHRADDDLVAVLLARLRLREADRGDLGVRCRRSAASSGSRSRRRGRARSRRRSRPRGRPCGRAASWPRRRRPRRCAGRSCACGSRPGCGAARRSRRRPRARCPRRWRRVRWRRARRRPRAACSLAWPVS